MRRLPGLTTQILIALAIGIAVGWASPETASAVKPLADLFIRLIKMIVAPLLFSTLVVGIAGGGDLKTTGRIGLKTMIYFQLTTVVAFVVSFTLVNLVKPGVGVPILNAPAADTAAMTSLAGGGRTGWDVILQMIPTSIVDAMARGDILQVVIFATIFGTALAAIGPKGRPVVDVLESVAQTMFTVTRYVMMLAPLGVFAAIAATVGSQGISILIALGKLVAVMYVGLTIYLLIVIGATAYAAGVPAIAFFKAVRQPFLIAFGTASSEAALPKALEVMERFGAPKHIVSFVLPAGYSFNQDGSTLYMATAAVFVAQLSGMSLSFTQQAGIMLMLLLAGNGVAGVPRAALVVLTGTLSTLGLPLESAAILLGIDHILDMGRTATNVTGNCLATVAIARWEGVFDDRQMRAFKATEPSAA